jgi:hypothetical protein
MAVLQTSLSTPEKKSELFVAHKPVDIEGIFVLLPIVLHRAIWDQPHGTIESGIAAYVYRWRRQTADRRHGEVK